MSKDKIQILSPLFLKYQNDFEKNPRSRVFAPLAESYRKLGMTDKAMEILSHGIRFHPTYIMGYLGLAFCYFDLKQYNLAYTTLRPLIENNRDNLRLQKLFSDTCLELGKQEEALDTLKYLLFINPRDKNVANLVLKLEKEIEERYRPNHRPIIIPEEELTGKIISPEEMTLFDLGKLNSIKSSEQNEFDDWMAIDLNKEMKTEKKEVSKKEEPLPASYDHWNVKKLKDTEEDKTYSVHLDLDKDSEDELETDSNINSEANLLISKTEPEPHRLQKDVPIVTHTLVDLYCGQGHIEKALEVLEKILILNPNDQKTINKIHEIQSLISPYEEVVEETMIHPEADTSAKGIDVEFESISESDTEEDGRRHLMNLIDEKLGPIALEEYDSREILVRKIEDKLGEFLKRIHKRALDYQSRI